MVHIIALIAIIIAIVSTLRSKHLSNKINGTEKILGYKTQLINANEALEVTNVAHNALKLKYDSLVQSGLTISKAHTELLSKNNQLNAQLESYDNKITDYKTKEIKLTSEVDNLIKENHELSVQNDEKQKTIANLQTANSDLARRNVDFNNIIIGNERQIKALNAHIKDDIAALDKLTAYSKDLEVEVERLKEQLKTYPNEVAVKRTRKTSK